MSKIGEIPMPQDLSVEQFRQTVADVEAELAQMIVGQRDVVRHVLIGLLTGGHVLLESVPGLGKTLLVGTLAQILDLSFARLQLTPDLVPGDIAGSGVPTRDNAVRTRARFHTGTLFANLILADEINRAAPRTQSALLQAMQERTVDIAGRTCPLPQPFLVVASQDPFETDGAHPLSQAQVDRFLFKLEVVFPDAAELAEILERTTAEALPQVQVVADGPTVLRMADLARGVTVGDAVRDHAARLLLATQPDHPTAPEAVRRHVRRGAGPRGGQAMIRGARVVALLDGRNEVAVEDLRALALPSLRHRVLLGAEGEIEGGICDRVLEAVLDAVPEEGEV
jgi:MoxR-like ATPase